MAESRPPLLCAACRGEFTDLPAEICDRCAMPWKGKSGGASCPHCRHRRYYFDEAISLGIYRDKLRLAIRRMKRPAHEQLTCAVGRLLAERVRAKFADPPPEVVVPVPMHWLRYWTRGVNGAQVLAEVVGRELGLAVWPDLVRCRRRTRKQGTLSPADRFSNVRRAFRLAPGFDLERSRLLLVDDVMTTGATLSEVARELRRGGAASVRVAVVGRGTGTS